MKKSPDAFRTISEVAEWLETPAHVLRFWESRFSELKPVQRAGGRRYYRPDDMLLLGGIKHLLHTEGHTIKSVQDRINAEGTAAVAALSPPLDAQRQSSPPDAGPAPQSDKAADTIPPRELVGAGGGAMGMPFDADPPQDDDAMLTDPADDDAPPIGFFFDDSDDAAPAEAQSGTFAQPADPAPPSPGKTTARDATPPAVPDHPPPAPVLGALPSMPDDPPDDAAGVGPPLPLPARLRALQRADVPAARMDILTGLFRRLEGWFRAGA